jgi:hypothetical protein
MKARFPTRRSLRRRALRERRRLQGASRLDRASRGLAWARMRCKDADALWSIGIMAAAVWLPVPFPRIVARGGAADFTQTLWQVEAGVLALFLTVAVFAFEAVGSRRFREPFVEFAEDTNFFAVLYLGLGALAATGLVASGHGYGSDGRWALAWVVTLAALELLGLPRLMAKILRLLDPGRLQERRLGKLRQTARRHVHEDIVEQFALSFLQEECVAADIDFSVWDTSIASASRTVFAPQDGVVSDIDLARLRATGLDPGIRTGQSMKPSLRVRLGSVVARGDPLLVLPQSTCASQFRRASRAFRVEPRLDSDPIERAADDLHDEALDAIRAGSPAELARVMSTYGDLLLELPRVWAEHGQPFTRQAATGLTPFGLGGALNRLGRNLRREVERLVLDDNDELAGVFLDFVNRTTRAATDLGAFALVSELQGLEAYAFALSEAT